MPKKSIILLPETEEILEQMGLQIKYARLRNFGFNRERCIISSDWILCGGITCT